MTIGDFWGIGKYGVPFNHDIKHGVSAILVNSPRGEKLITELNTELFIEERKLAEALKLNYQLTTPSHRPKQRNDSYEFIFTHSYEQIENKYFGSPLYRKTRHLVGNVLRFLKIYG